MRATTWPAEQKGQWHPPKINAGATNLFDSEHDALRALLLVLFYGGLVVLYAGVSLAKQAGLVLGRFHRTPQNSARLAWLAGKRDVREKFWRTEARAGITPQAGQSNLL